MPVTERLILNVSAGQDWKDPLKFMLQTFKKQDGYLRTRWGPHSENENNLELLIGWESTDAQSTFQKSPAFEEMMSQMKPILSGLPTVYFVQFVPYAPKEVIDASIVQVITVTGSSSDEATLRSSIESYKSLEGCTGAASGLSLSEVQGKGKVFVGVVGWDSLEASEKASSSSTFKVDGETEEHHVNFRYPVKGFRGL